MGKQEGTMSRSKVWHSKKNLKRTNVWINYTYESKEEKEEGVVIVALAMTNGEVGQHSEYGGDRP